MSLKFFKPLNPSLRHCCLVKKDLLWKGKPLKTKILSSKNFGGRNNSGKITVRGRKSFFRNRKRIINFNLNPENFIPSTIIRLEYDPCRSSFIALIRQLNGVYFYILAPEKLDIKKKISIIDKFSYYIGCFGYLKNIPVGTVICNIELYKGKGSQLVRSAGCFGQIIKKNDFNYITVRISSGQRRILQSNSVAMIGTISNVDHKYINYGKAGRIRLSGFKSHVRGVAMNPVDHPHGGGEGKTSGGRPSVTPWAKITKNKKTRTSIRNSKYIILKY